MDPIEISKKLTTEDTNILKQALRFVDTRIALMRERAKIAETRATAMLVVSGILAGLIVHFGKTVQDQDISMYILFVCLYLTSIFLLIKATYYSIKALWVLKGNELNSELAFDLQRKSEDEALKEELKWKIWEYYEILPLTNEKLFWLNRSQRNIVAAIISFMFLGIIIFIKLIFIKLKLNIEIPCFMTAIIILASMFLVFFIDITLERFSGSPWHKQ